MTPKLNSNFYLHCIKICLDQMYRIVLIFIISYLIKIEKDQREGSNQYHVNAWSHT